MDADARHYQSQLHEMNQKRMDAQDEKLDLILESVSRNDSLHEEFPKLVERVGNLEKQREFGRGVIAAVALIGGITGKWTGSLVEWCFHHWSGK